MDQRAVNILLRTYWTPAGWRPERERHLSEEDFEYAKSAGVMFDSVESNHDQFVRQLAHLVSKCDKTAIANAFLASLSSRRLDWRSALGSYAVFRSMKPHVAPAGQLSCGHCGMYVKQEPLDLNVLNFERLKWGGVRHLHVEYALLDLTLFNQSSAAAPTSKDIDIFWELISACREAGDEVTSSSLHKSLPRSLKGNKAEKDTLVAILGFTGVLGTTVHPGFDSTFVPANARELPNRRFVDMSYPACWWTGTEGVNEKALTEFFGHIAQ